MFSLSQFSFYITEIGDGWHPAYAEDDLEYLLLHREQRALSDKREYWYQDYASKDEFGLEGQWQKLKKSQGRTETQIKFLHLKKVPIELQKERLHPK